MAYELYAILGTESTIDAAIQDLENARSVPLAQGIAMVPLTGDLLDELAQNHGPGEFGEVVAAWARTASRHGLLACCWAAYTGGIGSQGATVWRAGAELERTDSVNRALRLLDVSREDEDEWDAVGLGRCRQTEQWLTLARD